MDMTVANDPALRLNQRNRHSNTARRWVTALQKLEAAEAAFLPVSNAFDAAELAYFKAKAKCLAPTAEADICLRRDAHLEQASRQEKRFGKAMHEAAKAFFLVPAPDLTSLIRKVELIQTIGYEGCAETLILSDLRNLQSMEVTRDRP